LGRFAGEDLDMTSGSDISGHYARGDILARLRAALLDDGQDPDRPTLEALAPYDQFHGRGMEATEELAGGLEVSEGDHLLDVGSGIGGPARYMAARFGCRVTGIDLTAEFCAAARHLTGLLGLDGRVGFEQGDALAMPFAEASFDGAYSMNVSMNIADKLFHERLHEHRRQARALQGDSPRAPSRRPAGPVGNRAGAGRRSRLPDPLGAHGGLELPRHAGYPTPWARTAASSFLATPEETRAGLEASGFTVITSRDTVQESLAFGARSRAMVERGEKPPHRAVFLIHGELAPEAAANASRGVSEGRIVPIEVFCRKV
jgi:SAM-dependent methyltransferase